MQLVKVPTTPDPSKPLRASIFLAGPCPRDSGATDWRHECAAVFKSKGYDGALFWPVPDGNEDRKNFDINAQIAWETKHLKMADLIFFWVPRKIEGLAFAGFTTNVEFGLYHKSGKVVMGYPPEAEKMRYIAWWCDKIGAMPIESTMEGLVDLCLLKLKNLGYQSLTPVPKNGDDESLPMSSTVPIPKHDLTARYHGEQYIPLLLWRSQAFQDWYQNQLAQGNKLLWGDVDYVFDLFNEINQKIAPKKKEPTFHSSFIAVLKAHIQIGKENNRVKDNEVIVFRPDVCTVVPFYSDGGLDSDKDSSMKNVQVVLTSEFRTPCRNSFNNNVVEPPSGSSWEHIDFDPTFSSSSSSSSEKKQELYKKIALEELHEEADIDISTSDGESRLIYVGSRQVASTLSSHYNHVFAVKLSKEEFEKCKKNAQEGRVFGVEEDTERTKLKIMSFGEIICGGVDSGLDWSAVGVISQTIMKSFGF